MNTKNINTWTQEELNEWKKKQEQINPIYLEMADKQLLEWVNGKSIHNPHPRIISVVDESGKIIKYYLSEGGECCPDFS